MTIDVLTAFNINTSGKGSRPILFANGLGCDQNVWRYVAPAFEDDYKVILFDYVGSGKSDKSIYNKDKYQSLNGYADDVLAICDALNTRDVILVAHSVSSMIGLLAAIKRPQFFSRIIMLGPSPCYMNIPPYFGGFTKEDLHQLLDLMKENYPQWASYFAPLAVGNPDRPQIADQVETTFCTADPDITCEFAKAAFLADNRADLCKLTVPTLIMQPAEDIVAPTQVGEYTHKNIAGSTIYYMKGTGHFPLLSAVDETISMIKQYLQKTEGDSPVTDSHLQA